jgi:Fe-S-cluster-containing dehydrogenase component/formate-dependent nitrite reductase membrane component NrfD
MQYGFLMDHRRCIGCHACTVACESENDVPLGSFRTWVKYTEKGLFPAVKRHFSVLRCNHCTNAPCVTICPVNALEKRSDGIVDLDRDACIGCRACMQGCPYDAIYLNQDTGAAEKCHFCAHRIEQELAPACVIVCPEEAIVFGDLHDPSTKIARMVKEHATLVRRPEQRTGPNVHYLETLPEALEPGLAGRPDTYLWSERPPTKPEPWPAGVPTARDVRTVLDVGHRVHWGWPVAAYLVTKGIAAGAAMLAPFAAELGLRGAAAKWAPELIALAFTLITTFLLVEDLHRPLKFLTLLTRPNKRSWLVKGAWILIAFSTTVSATLACTWLGDALDPSWAAWVAPLRWVGAVLALGVAGYTAWLFAQCEGRDLWQSRLLLPHLLVQGILCGAVAYLAFAPGNEVLRWIALGALAAHALLALLERHSGHATANARQAAAFLDVVRWGRLPVFALGFVLAGASVALLFAVPGLAWLPALAALFAYEHAYVRAGQLPPLS